MQCKSLCHTFNSHGLKPCLLGSDCTTSWRRRGDGGGRRREEGGGRGGGGRREERRREEGGGRGGGGRGRRRREGEGGEDQSRCVSYLHLPEPNLVSKESSCVDVHEYICWCSAQSVAGCFNDCNRLVWGRGRGGRERGGGGGVRGGHHTRSEGNKANARTLTACLCLLLMVVTPACLRLWREECS